MADISITDKMKIAVLEEAFIETIHFLIVEQGWEWFRAEMLYLNDKEKMSQSEKNAKLIAKHIADLSETSPFLKQLISEAEKRASE